MSAGDALDELERQHAQVERCLDAFIDTLVHAGQGARSEDALRELIAELSMHFGYEEGVMDGLGFAEFEHHRRQHMGILIELGLLLDRIEASDPAAELLRSADFLDHWYRQHIAYSDRVFVGWLQSRG
jgi:hemerythrin-like metal-binding protein